MGSPQKEARSIRCLFARLVTISSPPSPAKGGKAYSMRYHNPART